MSQLQLYIQGMLPNTPVFESPMMNFTFLIFSEDLFGYMHVYGRNARNVYILGSINMQPRNSSTCRRRCVQVLLPKHSLLCHIHSRHAIKMTKIWY